MRIHQSVFARIFVFATIAFALSLAFVAVRVNASTVSECQALIAALRTDTESVVIVGKNAEKNRAGLVSKLDGASVSLDRVKLCDALRKLTDYRNKVNQLIVSGSINADPAVGVTGQDLVNGADEAIACVQSLVAQSGGTCPVTE
ncbi:MAG TPA: hypothetical protein VJR02_29380 [Pyrinomonadaceae bacterium]|nr:hypothetical protein [Pyrinomonadaceae bacterium]